MTFRVGQKVVCVSTWDRNGKGYGDEVGPVKGSIYTVRQIGIGLSRKFPDQMQVRVFEILNPTHLYTGGGVYEIAFAAWRFRPTVERKTDISVFTEILRTAKVPATVAALCLVLAGCGDPVIVRVRDGEMAGCAVNSRGPTVADVADCRAWQIEKSRQNLPTGTERDANDMRARMDAVEKRLQVLESKP